MSLHFSWKRLFIGKPFDDFIERPVAREIYGSTPIFGVLILSCGVSQIVALALMFFDSRAAMLAMSFAIALSAITAGLEFNRGLRAIPLNQLFVCLIVASLYYFG